MAGGTEAPRAGTVALRPCGQADAAFERDLFASTRIDELAELGARGIDATAFIELQLRAQQAAYRARFADATVDVIEVDGGAAGRLVLADGDSELRIVDIALLPRWRNRGVGGAVLSALIRRAGERGQALVLTVAASNPARRLYERLGFESVGDDGVHVFMRRRAGAATGGAQENTAS